MKSTVKRAVATPVVVPARPDSLNSAGIEEDDSSFSNKFQTGKSWDDFANQVKWILELETGDGCTGIGETYRSVPLNDIRKILPGLIGLDVLKSDWRNLPLEHPRVYDAVESAVMDLAGKHLGVPVHQLLGGACRSRVDCNGWTGRRTPEDAASKACEAMQRGHRVFKFKCSDSDPVRLWLDAIRERCGTKIKILLDPNQRWKDVETTLRLLENVDFSNFYGLEDPITRADYTGFRDLRKQLKPLPLFIHIALPYRHQGQSAADILPVLSEHCADGFNFNGPMFAFLQLAATAGLDGLPCWHGSEVDLGILEASALHACAAATHCTIPSDIFGELVRVNDLIKNPILFEDGYALVPQGPGLGIELDTSALRQYQAGESIAA